MSRVLSKKKHLVTPATWRKFTWSQARMFRTEFWKMASFIRHTWVYNDRLQGGPLWSLQMRLYMIPFNGLKINMGFTGGRVFTLYFQRVNLGDPRHRLLCNTTECFPTTEFLAVLWGVVAVGKAQDFFELNFRRWVSAFFFFWVDRKRRFQGKSPLVN